MTKMDQAGAGVGWSPCASLENSEFPLLIAILNVLGVTKQSDWNARTLLRKCRMV